MVSVTEENTSGEAPLLAKFYLTTEESAPVAVRAVIVGYSPSPVFNFEVDSSEAYVFEHLFEEVGGYQVTFLRPGQQPFADFDIHVLQLVDPEPEDPTETDGVISARMVLKRVVDHGGGAISEARIEANLPTDDVVGHEAAAAALLPLYEAQDCEFLRIETTERSTSTEDPRIS